MKQNRALSSVYLETWVGNCAIYPLKTENSVSGLSGKSGEKLGLLARSTVTIPQALCILYDLGNLIKGEALEGVPGLFY